MDLAEKYVEGLKNAYGENGFAEEWAAFESVAHGADDGAVAKLRSVYPDTPDTLLQLLAIVDGTYWREYGGEKIAFYFLGSDLEEFPYYLLSVEQMLDRERFAWLKDFINREYEDLEIDERIIDAAEAIRWLHFADCFNNGGCSQLFIDFSPSAKGVKGQIVRYLHDPDELEVIADSFDDYLQMLMDDGYDFISEDAF